MTRIALITGANKGIGFATARLLGERGMTVLVGARDSGRGQAAVETLREAGIDAHPVTLDVTDEATIEKAAAWIGAEFGHLDVLVNNAAITRIDGTGRPSETTLATLRAVFETNVYGVVAVTNAMLPLLRKGTSPRIVNVSSEVGSIGFMTAPDSPLRDVAGIPYPASKTALNMVTVMYAKELRESGIKVNAANPGYCATDLNNNSGFRTPEQGAEVTVYLATLPDDGPTGTLWGYLWRTDGTDGYGVLPW